MLVAGRRQGRGNGSVVGLGGAREGRRSNKAGDERQAVGPTRNEQCKIMENGCNTRSRSEFETAFGVKEKRRG